MVAILFPGFPLVTRGYHCSSPAGLGGETKNIVRLQSIPRVPVGHPGLPLFKPCGLGWGNKEHCEVAIHSLGSLWSPGANIV